METLQLTHEQNALKNQIVAIAQNYPGYTKYTVRYALSPNKIRIVIYTKSNLMVDPIIKSIKDVVYYHRKIVTVQIEQPTGNKIDI